MSNITKLRITVTKEILKRSQFCGCMMDRCAISQAIADVFPDAATGYSCIIPFAMQWPLGEQWSINWAEARTKMPSDNYIELPESAYEFISLFDRTPEKERKNLPEFSFEIEIHDRIIERINIDEIRPLLQNHPTLELIEQ